MQKSLQALLLISLSLYTAQIYSQTNIFPSNGNTGIGTTAPSAWFPGKVLEIKDERPILRLSPINEGGLGTILFKGAYNSTPGSPDEFHLNYVSNPTNPKITLGGYLNNNSAALFSMNGNGKVGIGTDIPAAHLNVDPKGPGGILIGNPQTDTGGLTSLYIAISANASGYAELQAVQNAGSAWGNILLNKFGGNVGIGTEHPEAKLTISGNVSAKEVKVKVDAGADYVFSRDYKLESLEDLETFVKEKFHLPGIPTAKEMQENGIGLSDMYIKLLSKVEELTIHIIDLNKQINTLRNENTKLAKKE